jgi:hypothetical protein
MSVTAFRDTDVSSPVLPVTPPPATVQIINQEVKITFTSDGPDGLYSAHSDPPAITLLFDNVAMILWTLVPPDGIATADVQFETPPITFPDGQAPAPMQIVDRPNPQQVIGVWTNTNQVAGSGIYHYSIHALVDGQQVTHDPTVQNDPPPPPPGF